MIWSAAGRILIAAILKRVQELPKLGDIVAVGVTIGSVPVVEMLRATILIVRPPFMSSTDTLAQAVVQVPPQRGGNGKAAATAGSEKSHSPAPSIKAIL